MRIALISYEFAGTPRTGGIGTYVRGAANMLAQRGHNVEVFTSGETDGTASISQGCRVNMVAGPRQDFAQRITEVFRQRHSAKPFDVLEGPEYGAEAGPTSREFFEVPLVVKLHAPTFTINQSNQAYIPLSAKLRFIGGALRRGRIPHNPWHYEPASDPEHVHTLQADEIVANSVATAQRVQAEWSLPAERLSVVPYVFSPSKNMTELPIERANGRVMFFGRLEVRKGVIDLARAIPMVLRDAPDTKFRFVGRDLPHPSDRRPVSQHIRELAEGAGEGLEILPGVPYGELPRLLAEADIAVLPSHWEASGFVCMEAMAAGCAVIGSSSGGMAELIRHGQNGLLVPPLRPNVLASAIGQMLADPKARLSMASAGRAAVIAGHAESQIGPLQEESYKRAIKNHSIVRRRGQSN